MTHLYSSCRSACLSATWRFRDALLHSTLPHSWQVNNFFADWVFREFKDSPVIEVSTETQQRTSHAAAHPQHTLRLVPTAFFHRTTPPVEEKRPRPPSPPLLSPRPPLVRAIVFARVFSSLFSFSFACFICCVARALCNSSERLGDDE